MPWIRLAIEYDCPTCGAERGKPCIKRSKKFIAQSHQFGLRRRGEPKPTYEYAHSKRHWRAYAAVRDSLEGRRP